MIYNNQQRNNKMYLYYITHPIAQWQNLILKDPGNSERGGGIMKISRKRRNKEKSRKTKKERNNQNKRQRESGSLLEKDREKGVC